MLGKGAGTQAPERGSTGSSSTRERTRAGAPAIEGESAPNPRWSALATSARATPKAPAKVPARVAPTRVAAPDEGLEREADQLTEMMSGRVGRGRASAAAAEDPPPPSSLSGPLGGGGAPLPSASRQRFEAALGGDLGAARIHTDAQANRAADELDARAFTLGADIYFGRGHYQPETVAGDLLLAHELVHVVQAQLGADPSVIRRTPNGRADPSWPPRCSVAYSVQGVAFVPTEAEVRFRGDRSELQQGAEIVVGAVTGDRYTDELGLETYRFLQRRGHPVHFTATDERGQARRIRRLFATTSAAVDAFNFAYFRLRPNPRTPITQVLDITPAQVEILEAGLSAGQLWTRREGWGFPEWYDRTLFNAEIVNHRDALRRFQQASRGDSPLTTSIAAGAILQPLSETARVIDRLRAYRPLWVDGEFRRLWGLGPVPDNATPLSVTGPGPRQAPNARLVQVLAAFVRSQPGPFQRALNNEGGDPDPRQLLWDRFLRYAGRAAVTSRDLRDQVLRQGYSDRNAPPLPSSLTVYPPLEPPFFDAALGTDHGFVMEVQFSDVYEHLANAFGGFQYIFEILQVKGDDLDRVEATAARAPGAGEQVGWGEVWSARMGRQLRYAAADQATVADSLDPFADPRAQGVRRDIQRLVFLLGPVGRGASSLVALNSAIRAIGEVISTFFQMLTTPRHEKRVVFPSEGLFVVRAFCTPELTEESEYRRATSVAWMPVWARTTRTMSRLRATRDLEARLANELALANVIARLEQLEECSEERQALLDQRRRLSRSLYGSAAQALSSQREQLVSRRRALRRRARPETENMSESQRQAAISALDRAITSIDQRLEVRRRRNTGGRLDRGERLIATFVTDTGRVIRPLLEAVELSDDDNRFRYYVSDLTNENAGHANGEGTTRSAAILAALESLFEHHTGYGRGELTVFIPSRRQGSTGRFHSLRIEASLTAIGLETIESVTTLVTIAAMVAAPFTGGASLAILLPVGIIGSLPSAYRIADRSDAGTLRMDMQTAMDLVDIVGSLAGGAQAVAGRSLRFARTARFLAVVGAGSDGLGVIAVNYQLIEQARQLPNDLSPGERRLAIMRLIGQGLQANGMAVGGQLLSRAGGRGGDAPRSRSRADADPHVRPDTQPRPPTRPDPEASARLPRDLRGTVDVEIDHSLGGPDSTTVHVDYRLDRWGLVTDIRILRAEGAGQVDIDLHLDTVRQMRRYAGISGWLRNLLNRALGGVGFERLRPGSLAWEARLELRKLPRIIESRMAELRASVESGTPVDRGRIEAEIAFLREQLAAHQRTLDDAASARSRGRGFVAAESQDPAQRRAYLEQRRGSSEPVLDSRPAGWTGALEAEWRGYPSAPADHHWRLTPDGSRLLLQNNGDGPNMAYDSVNARFVPLVEGTPSPTTAEAIFHGYPAPPTGHHYVTVGDGSYRLVLDPDAAARPDVTPQALVRNEDGSYGFTPRPEGSTPEITIRDPLSTSRVETAEVDPHVGAGESIDSLLAARNQAIQRRIALESQAPSPGTPAYEAWRNSPAYRRYTRQANRVAQASRDLGEVAAESYVRSRYPGAERIWPPGASRMSDAPSQVGDFDQVWRVQNDSGVTRYIVVESKGGASTLGSRVTGEGVRVQQGTRRYYNAIIANMSRPSAPADMRAVGQTLRSQAVPGVNVQYLRVQQPLTTSVQPNGTVTTTRGQLSVAEFDIGTIEPRPSD